MNVKAGKYIITNDSRQYMLSEFKISKAEKTAGEEIKFNTTYHSTLPAVLDALLDRKIKESDATTLTELKNDWNDSVEWVKSQFII